MKFYFLLLAAVFLTTSTWAKEQGITDKEITIGGFTAESGKFAIYASIGRAATAYFDRLNESGGINGRKIKYIRIDTQGEHVKSVQAGKKLVEEDGIAAFFLNVGATHKSVYKYIMENNVPDFYFTDGLLEYGKPFKKLLFPGTGSAPIFIEGKTLGQLAASKYKGKKACFLVTDDEVGEQFINGGKEGIEEINKTLKKGEQITYGAIERAERSLPQVNSQVLNLKKDKCDFVLNGLFSTLGPSSVAYASTQDFKPGWMMISWNVGPKFIELLPENAREGIFSVTTLAIDDNFAVPGWDDFSKLMKKADIPMQRAQVGYAAAELMSEVIKRAGKDVTRESLIKAAESMTDFKCSLCLAPNEVSATNHVPFSKPTVIVTKGGKWVRN